MSSKKIAVPSDDQIDVSAHTGRCRYLMIYTVSADAILGKEAVENSFTAHARGECREDTPGAGHHAGHSNHSHTALIEAIEGCSVLLSRGFGQRLKDDFEESGINAYVTDEEGTADEIVQKYLSGDLRVLTTSSCGCEKHRH